MPADTAAMKLKITERSDTYWRVGLENPPLNLLDPELLTELQDAVTRMESHPTLAVVVFESLLPDYFMAHLDLARLDEFDTRPGPTGLSQWPDVTTRLEHAAFVTIGMLRGRARGVGSEFLLALDLRFASREKAVLGHPEVGIGLFPGGGALERLPPLLGRARALEVILGCDDYSACTAQRYGWINESVPDAELDAFVDRLACRLARFGRDTLGRAKSLLNARCRPPAAADLRETQERFQAHLQRPAVQAKLRQSFERGLQTDGLLERNFGSLLGLQ
ncbi:MAG: Enoyl-CoA hydratase/isomerase [Burkholderiales bacterium]|jgi:enoyl-CoA hydratase/carnithine racemase|nr:Enoyl-CoA hydratase/isomerase [Burkholderiales bacterium]